MGGELGKAVSVDAAALHPGAEDLFSKEVKDSRSHKEEDVDGRYGYIARKSNRAGYPAGGYAKADSADKLQIAGWRLKPADYNVGCERGGCHSQ